jgi:DeoR family glycerol-3-phosphate regulon repressor
VLRSGTSNIGYEDRRALNAEAKARIANSLAARIPNGASVFLDIGTTIEAVAEALSRHEGLLVVTNSMNAAAAMSRNPDAEVVLTGGILRRTDGGLVGEVTADFVRQFRVDTAVIAASAIDPTGDALDFDFREVRVAQAMIAQSRRAVLVADHSKYDRVAPVRIAALDAFSMFVTDKAPPASIAEAAQRGNTEILTT